jgi:tetratricopeptide (TPR) repeat protein
VYAYGTYQRNNVWHTEESLWYDVTQKSPLNGRGLMNYGLTQMGKGNYAAADSCFTKALTLLPSYYALCINMGVLKDATGDKAAAENYFLRAIQLGSGFQDSYFFYGRFLTHVDRYTEAAVQLKKAIDISPAYLEARLLLMDVYENMGNWDELKALAQSTLQIVPDNAIVSQYLDAGKNRIGKLERLAADVKAVPTADRYLDLSLKYFTAGRYQQSIGAAQDAIKLKPALAEAYNNIGSAYNALKQYAKAIAPLSRAIELKPDFQLAKNNLLVAQNALYPAKVATQNNPVITAEGYLNQSLADFNNGNYQECIDACYKALKLKPGYDLAYNNICAAYNKLGQYDKAIKAGEEGIKLNPKNQLLKNNLQESYNKKK